MKPIGHTRVVAALEKSLSQITLLHGPESVGKRCVAEYACEVHSINPDKLDNLRIDKSRQLIENFSFAPMSGTKSAIIDLDGATSESLNALLHLLEEPPDYVQFLLVASKPTLPTIESRAVRFACGYLSDDEVLQVLLAQGWNESEAIRATKQAGGQVSKALTYGDRQRLKGPVVACLRAAINHDSELLRNALLKFTDENADMMRQWLSEARSQCWRVFSPDETPEVPMAILGRLEGAFASGARPRLAIRYALDPIVSG